MKINKHQQKELEALTKMSDSDIDYSDIPNTSNAQDYVRMNNKQFNKFVKSDLPLNEFIMLMHKGDDEMVTVNMRLNKEVVDFFKEHSKHYQVKINEALMMLVHQYKHLRH